MVLLFLDFQNSYESPTNIDHSPATGCGGIGTDSVINRW